MVKRTFWRDDLIQCSRFGCETPVQCAIDGTCASKAPPCQYGLECAWPECVACVVIVKRDCVRVRLAQRTPQQVFRQALYLMDV